MTMRFAYHGAAANAEPRPSSGAWLGAMLDRPVAILCVWARRRHERRDLLRLDDHMLRDIGLDRSRADKVAARPFWRA